MTLSVLGVDPGHEGGAVLLVGSRVAAALAWRRLSRKSGDVYATTSLDGDEQTEPSLHGVSMRILSELAGARVAARAERHAFDLSAPWYHLVVEGLFARPGLALHGVTSLAEATGEVTGPLRSAAISVERPKASEWRAAVLPKRWGTKSEDAERAAMVLCRALHPSLGDFLVGEPGPGGRPSPCWPHVVEAACIARWGQAQQQVSTASR
jgi:hypothetical protein